jgi:hypothetical protein
MSVIVATLSSLRESTAGEAGGELAEHESSYDTRTESLAHGCNRSG